MTDRSDAAFIRSWSEKAYDHSQLAAIQEIENHLIAYAMTAWRSLGVEPPANTLLICACQEGLVLMTKNSNGEWRTNLGQPHKPPYAWMPAPIPPSNNGVH